MLRLGSAHQPPHARPRQIRHTLLADANRSLRHHHNPRASEPLIPQQSLHHAQHTTHTLQHTTNHAPLHTVSHPTLPRIVHCTRQLTLDTDPATTGAVHHHDTRPVLAGSLAQRPQVSEYPQLLPAHSTGQQSLNQTDT